MHCHLLPCSIQNRLDTVLKFQPCGLGNHGLSQTSTFKNVLLLLHSLQQGYIIATKKKVTESKHLPAKLSYALHSTNKECRAIKLLKCLHLYCRWKETNYLGHIYLCLTHVFNLQCNRAILKYLCTSNTVRREIHFNFIDWAKNMYSTSKMLAKFIYVQLTDAQLESVIKVMSKNSFSNRFF